MTGLPLHLGPRFLSVSSSSRHGSVPCRNLVQRSCLLLDPRGAELRALSSDAQGRLGLPSSVAASGSAAPGPGSAAGSRNQTTVLCPNRFVFLHMPSREEKQWVGEVMHRTASSRAGNTFTLSRHSAAAPALLPVIALPVPRPGSANHREVCCSSFLCRAQIRFQTRFPLCGAWHHTPASSPSRGHHPAVYAEPCLARFLAEGTGSSLPSPHEHGRKRSQLRSYGDKSGMELVPAPECTATWCQ